MRSRLGPAVLTVSLLLVAVATGDTPLIDQGGIEHFSALGINTGGFTGPRSGIIDIIVFSWSSEAEAQKLCATFAESGSRALLDALRDMPRLGFIRTDDNVAYTVRFARQVPGVDDGRRIILATDRRIRFWERAVRRPWLEYPFTVIEIRLNRRGEGEGKLSVATKIAANRSLNLIELEDYANQPVRLMSVQSSRPPTS